MFKYVIFGLLAWGSWGLISQNQAMQDMQKIMAIIKNSNITVTADEAKVEAANYVRSQFARYGQVPDEAEVAKIVEGILSKEKEAQKIFEGLYSKKVIDVLKTSCKLDTQEVSYNEFFGITE